jgi:hypothetical protein
MNSKRAENEDNARYEGNGWSKYQIMVLQQLEDHNRVLENLNKEVVNIKQQIAVSETEIKSWRSTAMSKLTILEEKMSHVLYDDTGLNRKISNMEKHFDVEEKVDTKIKAMWALIGAVAAVVINIATKFVEYWMKQ